MDMININDLTIEQYLRLTQEHQTPSMVKKVDDMTIAEYDMELDEEDGYTTDEESVMSEHEAIDPVHAFNTQYFEEELSLKEDLDEWLNEEMEKHMKADLKNSSEAMEDTINNDNLTSNLPSLEELNPGSFLLPFTINNYNSYAMANIDASNNVMPRSIYEYLKQANLEGVLLVKIVECGLLVTLIQVSVMVIKRFLEITNRECIDNGTPSTTTVSDKCPYKTNYPTPISPDEWDTRCHITYTGNTSNQDIPNNGPTPFSLEHSELGEKTNISKSPKLQPFRPRPYDYSFDEWIEEIGNPYSQRFDKYKRVFDNEVENLSNEYTLRIGKKRYVLDDVWKKCEQYHKKVIDSWHDVGYEEEELWRNGDEKTDYKPPIMDVKNFEVKKYSFKRGQSFPCITKQDDDALPLGRVNKERFKEMIRKELKDKGIAHSETFQQLRDDF
ncbi:hypothetical protein Tco_1549053 [Tanacetum coccineum]